MKIQHKTLKTLANGIPTPFTRVSSFKITRQTSPYAFICFANFLFFMSRTHIPEIMYFTGFAVLFDCSKTTAFQPYPPNFILGENSFCFLKFPISDFSNLGDNQSPLGEIWGIGFFPQLLLNLISKQIFKRHQKYFFISPHYTDFQTHHNIC